MLSQMRTTVTAEAIAAACGEEGWTKAGEQGSKCGEEFRGHGRKDDEAGPVGVKGCVIPETCRSRAGMDTGEERVVDDLYEPDETGHEERSGVLGEEKIFCKGVHGGNAIVAGDPARMCERQ